MDYTYLHYRIALTLLNHVGPKKARQLLASLNNWEELFDLKSQELSRKVGFSRSFIDKMARKEALQASEGVVSFIKKHEIKTLFCTDENYPKRLSECADSPLLLYQKGEENVDFKHWVAVVGTRNASPYGKAICRELIESFRGKNIVVVSGLALGIDSYVHQYCLEFDVPTIAVLGHGLDRIYPQKNRELAKTIIQKIISPSSNKQVVDWNTGAEGEVEIYFSATYKTGGTQISNHTALTIIPSDSTLE